MNRSLNYWTEIQKQQKMKSKDPIKKKNYVGKSQLWMRQFGQVDLEKWFK